MVTIPLKTRLEADGVVDLRVPAGLSEADVEVVVIVQPLAVHRKTWPKEFFDETYGAFADHPIARGDQAVFGDREVLR